MKKLFTKLMLVAVAAMGITACQNEPTEINVSAKKVTVEVIGEMDATRSSFGDRVENGDNDYYPSQWDGGEQVLFSLNEAALVTAENTGSGSKATFSVELTDDSTTEGTIYAFSPKGNYASGKGGFTNINTTYQDMYVVVPTEQNPTTTSVDPAAHLLAGKTTYTTGLPSSIKMAFNHATAYGRMELTNFAENVTKVKITASAALAGTGCYYYYAGEKEGQLTNADQTTITINNPAEDNKVFWFGCAPADLSEGSLEVKVYTADASYTKSIDLTGKELSFVQGQVSNFRVNMSGVAQDVVDETSYALVTSLADIEDGQYIIVGYNSSSAKYFALPAAAYSNGRIAGTEVTVTDNKVSSLDAEGNIWTITKSGDYYTISSGELYFDYGASSTNLKVAEADTNNTWAIAVGNAANTFNLVPQSENSRVLLFRTTNETNANYDQFGAYSSGNATSDEYSAIYLFKYGGTYKTALATPEVTATAEGNEITVSWTEIEGAKDYTVSCDGFEDKTVTGTSTTYTELEYSTTYNFSVVANPTDTENYTASNPGTASATTEADPNAAAPTDGYKLITSMAELTDGEYIIAGYMNSKYYALPNNVTGAKIAGSEITVVSDYVTSSTANLIWTISKSGNYYTIFDGTNYIYHSKGGNSGTDLAKGTTSSYPWSISYNTSGFKLAAVNGTTVKTRGMLMNNTPQFGGYALSNYGNSSYSGIYLFKKIGEGSGDEGGSDEPTTLATPNLRSSNITTTGYTVEWDAVANASNYEVSVNGGAATVVTGTSYTVSDATSNTTYTVSVIAKGDGTSYLDSTAASISVTTLTESSGGDDVSTVTESLEVYGSTGTLASDSSSISWTGTNFTVTNIKGSTAIRTDDTTHYRAYQGSTLTLTALNGLSFTKLVFTCTSSSYATELVNSLGSSASASGATVTWTGSAAEVSCSLVKQVRISKVEATLQ